jgi:hypothetical protein
MEESKLSMGQTYVWDIKQVSHLVFDFKGLMPQRLHKPSEALLSK